MLVRNRMSRYPVTTNPAAMKVWKAQSVLTYQIGNRSYAKSRTVLRSQ